jgi:N-acetylglucosamine-6-sulfatase
MKRIIVLIFLWLAELFLGQSPSVAQTPVKRPNLILILTDDLDARALSMLPRLRALFADKGTTFTNAFVTTSTCCPSRASILRGQYAHNHQVETNELPNGGFQRFYELGLESSTVATWLQAAGYKTMLVGKYLNDYPGKLPGTYVPPGWDEWYGKLASPVYFNFKLNQNGRVVSYGSKPEDYLTDVQARIVLDFVQRAVASDQPFFMYLAPTAPHNEVLNSNSIPPVAAPRHENEFPGVMAPRVPSFNEDAVGDKPIWLRDAFPLLDADGIGIVDEYYRKRLQSMLAVEELIDNLITALEKAGAMENTYIFFTSDNGFHLGEHRLPPQKCTPYEEDVRVPLMVRGPGVPASQIVDKIALNIDLAPTFAELAGIQAPEFVDGRSLVPLLNGNFAQAPAWRQAFLVEFWQLPNLSFPTYKAIRTLDCKYVEWDIGDRELYELLNDPFELYSLHRQASPQLMRNLSSELFRLSLCAGDSCDRPIDLKLYVCSEPVPEEMALYQNYPNPFNASTIIRYALKRPAHVKLKLFDIHGREVMTLIDEPQPAGSNLIILNSAKLSSGVYFYRLIAGAFEQTKKLVIVK